MWSMLRFVVLICSIFGFVNASGYEGYKIYDVVPSTAEQVNWLHNLSHDERVYDFFSLSRLQNHSSRVMVAPKEQAKFLTMLQYYGISHKVINKNVAQSLAEEYHRNQLLRAEIPFNTRGLSTERYYTHDEINAYITELAARYPTRAFVKEIGRSFEGRTVKTITITNGDGRANKQVILMDGGFHAREWISPAAVIYAIEQLVENFEANAELLLDYDWVILPVVNPDGYEYTQLTAESRMWRKTRQPLQINGEICYGTDPNRNFDFHWNEEGASSDPCAMTFAGPKAFSEPEAVIVRDIIHTLVGRGIMYLTVHSYGKYVLYPWGWTNTVPDTWEDLHEVAQAGADAIFAATGTEYTVGSSTNVLYVAAGASDDYAFNAGFPISFTMELPAEGPNGFDPPASFIDEFVKETWIGIRAMAAKVVVKYPLVK